MVFTCNATNITPVFHWELDNVNIGGYRFDLTAEYPLGLTVTSPLIEYIQVINATRSVRSSVNIISTLRVSSVSALNGLLLHCEDNILGLESNKVNITVINQGNNGVRSNVS